MDTENNVSINKTEEFSKEKLTTIGRIEEALNDVEENTAKDTEECALYMKQFKDPTIRFSDLVAYKNGIGASAEGGLDLALQPNSAQKVSEKTDEFSQVLYL